MKFQIYEDKAGEFRFRLVAGNGEILAVGEGYKNQSDCIHATELVRQAHDAPVEIIRDRENGL